MREIITHINIGESTLVMTDDSPIMLVSSKREDVIVKNLQSLRETLLANSLTSMFNITSINIGENSMTIEEGVKYIQTAVINTYSKLKEDDLDSVRRYPMGEHVSEVIYLNLGNQDIDETLLEIITDIASNYYTLGIFLYIGYTKEVDSKIKESVGNILLVQPDPDTAMSLVGNPFACLILRIDMGIVYSKIADLKNKVVKLNYKER